MTMFADFGPDDHGSPADVLVRQMAQGDVAACATLAVAREGGDADAWRSRFAARLADGRTPTFVACVPEVVGYGSVDYLDVSAHPGWYGAPDGWYLTGVVVAPQWRRLGVARALTLARVQWLSARTHTVYFFANQRNGASLRLHEQLGFVPMADDFDVGVPFEGGRGVLCRLQLT